MDVFSRRWLRGAVTAASLCVAVALTPSAGAQQPAPLPPPPVPFSPPPAPMPAPASGANVVVAYRAPSLVLVQPAGGGTVPQDKPVVVFRFAQGEAGDPVDARSFAVTVDGQDRTALFQMSVASAEAWGPLAPLAAQVAQPQPDVLTQALPAGAHDVAARVCSVRGVCTTVSAVVVAVSQGATSPASAPAIGVAQATAASTTKAASSPGRKARVLRRVLDAARILVP